MTDFQRSLSALERRDKLLAIENVANIAKIDVGRLARKGIPEIILAEGKEPQDVGRIAERMVKRAGLAIVSRANKQHFKSVRKELGHNAWVEYLERSRIVLAKSNSYRAKSTGGRVGILTAGTSDIPVAEGAAVVATEMGCRTRSYNDVGVAGLHRLFEPLRELIKWDADVILVVAGREGALPTVVAGLVDVPVIGVPTSRSYGFGEKGVAALAAMLQACSLGLSVVNIDGGVGAGAIAALTANRVARARGEHKTKKRSRRRLL
jgi:pyridinium-3,5-biscarboxylic acid mononucleotide synthase